MPIEPRIHPPAERSSADSAPAMVGGNHRASPSCGGPAVSCRPCAEVPWDSSQSELRASRSRTWEVLLAGNNPYEGGLPKSASDCRCRSVAAAVTQVGIFAGPRHEVDRGLGAAKILPDGGGGRTRGEHDAGMSLRAGQHISGRGNEYSRRARIRRNHYPERCVVDGRIEIGHAADRGVCAACWDVGSTCGQVGFRGHGRLVCHRSSRPRILSACVR